MNRHLLAMGWVALLLGGCQKDTTADTTRTTSATPVATTATTADNTKINERDRNGASTTPPNQNNSAADIDTTAQIRKALMADDSLSTDAKNIKIVTQDGNVVLRGPVKTAAEKALVESTASRAASGKRIENDLDVIVH